MWGFFYSLFYNAHKNWWMGKYSDFKSEYVKDAEEDKRTVEGLGGSPVTFEAS